MQVLVDNDGKASTGVSRTDNEGSPVAGIDQVLAYSYNVKGEVTEMKRDNNVDGKYDYREAYTLNPNGNREAKSVDLTNDGTLDRKEVYTKEADDGLVQTNFYNLVDNREVLTKIEYYKLNENNQRTELKVDTLGDGSTDSITRYDLDALGRETKAYIDSNGDDQPEKVETSYRNANGYVVRKEISSEVEGVHTAITYTYDALGNLKTESSYFGNNSKVRAEQSNKADRVITNYYDEYNNVIRVETDHNADGLADIISAASYNSKSELISSIEYVNLSDGTTSSASGQSYNTFRYDEYGNAIYAKHQHTHSPHNDSEVINTYNSSNLLKTRYFDYVNREDSINHFEYGYEQYPDKFSHIYNYAPNGNLLEIYELFYSNDGEHYYSLRDRLGDKSVDTLMYGHTGNGLSKNTHLDLTAFSNQELAKLGTSLSLIAFSTRESAVADELTISAEIVARISEGGLTINNGNQKEDTVYLSGFEKSTTSDRRGYDLYTATVDSEELKLYIDNTDMQVVLG